MLSLEDFKNIFDSIGYPLFIQDQQYKFVYVNNEICRDSGIPRERWIGSTEYDLFPKEQADAYRLRTNRVFEMGEKNTNEELNTDAHGNVKTLLTTKTLYTDEAGTKYVVAILRDITERKQTEEALRRSESLLYQAMDLASVVYWESESEGTFTFNDPFYTFLGTTAEREGGYHMTREEYTRRFIHPEDRPHISQAWQANASESTPRSSLGFEHRVIRRDGEERHIVVRRTVVKDASGRVISKYGINLDITKRKLAQQERERLISQLQTALEKVKTLSGLIPICSSCKKIRHDEGYWEQLEDYVGRHSHAEFSHSICPECATKLYPGLLD